MVAQLYPRALGSLFVASYDSQGHGGGILTSLHTGHWTLLKLKLSYDRQSVGQIVLVSGSHLEPMTRFFDNHWSSLHNSEVDQIEIITSLTSTVESISCFLATEIVLLVV
jgi:hypothetical protein